GFALPCDADAHILVDASRYLHFRDDFLQPLARAAAVAAGILVCRAFAVARRTSGLHPDNASGFDHPAPSAAIAADLASAGGSCARAFAILAVLVTLELDGFRDAFGRFVQREGHIAADVAALARPVATAAKQVAKDVAECRENILDVGEVMEPVTAQS